MHDRTVMAEALIKNKHGAIYAVGIFTKGLEGVYKVGLAFCNPKDFPSSQLSRAEWREKFQRIANGRMRAARAGKLRLVAQGDDENFKSLVERALIEMTGVWSEEHSVLAKHCLPENFGLPRFEGPEEKCEFQKWMQPFLEEVFAQRRKHKP